MAFRDVCNFNTIKAVLDIGEQPISNRYLLNTEQNEEHYPIVLGQCENIGLLSLVKMVPAEKLVPTFDWITYSEPEPHLDELVCHLLKLPGINKTSVVAGVSFKDTSTLQRLTNLGLKTWGIDANDDLAIGHDNSGVESVQAKLTVQVAKRIASNYGTADIVIARHIFEHAYDLQEFASALKELVTTDGYIVIELPDCEDSLNGCDYTMLWEEHLYYFTQGSFKTTLALMGFKLEQFEVYPYPMENSLVAVVSVADEKLSVNQCIQANEFSRVAKYVENFNPLKNQVRAYLEHQVAMNGKVAFFGAGHLACTFIWLFGLQDFILFVIDDDAHKQGKFMPGSKLPIVSSSALSTDGVKLCMLSVNPLSEDKIIQKHSEFVSEGGSFVSIFPNSPKSIYKKSI
jgi:hypothetical protein